MHALPHGHCRPTHRPPSHSVFAVIGRVVCQMCSARSLVAALLVASAFVAVCDAAFCHGHPDPNAKPNLKPIDTGAPVFVKSVPNAELWTVGTGEYAVSVVHLWGTPYQKGFAHGTLMKETMTQMMDEVWDYLEDQVEQAINGSMPNVFSNATLQFISDFGMHSIRLGNAHPFGRV
jgi:isopenicillin-N N-acyltransferase like protein